jgi:hypothetical protein
MVVALRTRVCADRRERVIGDSRKQMMARYMRILQEEGGREEEGRGEDSSG